MLAKDDAVDHVAAMVTQLSNRNLRHALSVSPVRRDWSVGDAALRGLSMERSGNSPFGVVDSVSGGVDSYEAPAMNAVTM
jgi:hypothetical protein